MVFNSVPFLIFFTVFFFLFWAVNKAASVKWRNILLIASSYFFYGWWDWRFLALIIISSASDYFIGIALGRTDKKSVRKYLVFASILVNLGILGFFKYFNFFIDSVSDVFSLLSINVSTTTLNVILPVGISFYTFQTLSYTLDVFRGKIKPTKDVLAFFAFVAFFPQLVAGPIERAQHLLIQFYDRKKFIYATVASGLKLVIWGFFKKLVIADNFGILSDSIFSNTDASGVLIILGALFFGFQIYTDFSGYSDIAIGIARMLGYDLRRNFITPYFAVSFQDFWRRWHISLSTWFRDYLYIPLGGSRMKQSRVVLNILITFLLSGLWHGAHITFLIWGFLHGLMLVIERFGQDLTKIRIYPFLVFMLVTLLWIPFRVEETDLFLDAIRQIFSFRHYNLSEVWMLINDFSGRRFLALSLVFLLFLYKEWRIGKVEYTQWLNSLPRIIRSIIYFTILIAILLLGNFDVKPDFIYFQF